MRKRWPHGRGVLCSVIFTTLPVFTGVRSVLVTVSHRKHRSHRGGWIGLELTPELIIGAIKQRAPWSWFPGILVRFFIVLPSFFSPTPPPSTIDFPGREKPAHSATVLNWRVLWCWIWSQQDPTTLYDAFCVWEIINMNRAKRQRRPKERERKKDRRDLRRTKGTTGLHSRVSVCVGIWRAWVGTPFDKFIDKNANLCISSGWSRR